MIITIDDLFIRVDEHGKVKYARSTKTGKFVKHCIAQAAVDYNRNQCILAVLWCVMCNVVGFGYLFLDNMGVI